MPSLQNLTLIYETLKFLPQKHEHFNDKRKYPHARNRLQQIIEYAGLLSLGLTFPGLLPQHAMRAA